MDLKAYEKRRVRDLYRRTLSVTSTADGAMQNVRGVASLLTRSLFGSASIATTYWTLWIVTISGIQLFSGTQIAGTRKKDSLTSVSLNLQNVESCSAVHCQRNYCQSNYQRVILMSLMKRVKIGRSSFGRTPNIQIVQKVLVLQDGRWIYTSTKVLIASFTMRESMSTI